MSSLNILKDETSHATYINMDYFKSLVMEVEKLCMVPRIIEIHEEHQVFSACKECMGKGNML